MQALPFSLKGGDTVEKTCAIYLDIDNFSALMVTATDHSYRSGITENNILDLVKALNAEGYSINLYDIKYRRSYHPKEVLDRLHNK